MFHKWSVKRTRFLAKTTIFQGYRRLIESSRNINVSIFQTLHPHFHKGKKQAFKIERGALLSLRSCLVSSNY